MREMSELGDIAYYLQVDSLESFLNNEDRIGRSCEEMRFKLLPKSRMNSLIFPGLCL